MSKALELLEQIKSVDENKYHKTRTIIFNSDDMEFLQEAIAELEAQEAKSCEGCANYLNNNSHKAWECTKANKFVMCGHAFEPPKNFCCNLHEPKATK